MKKIFAISILLLSRYLIAEPSSPIPPTPFSTQSSHAANASAADIDHQSHPTQKVAARFRCSNFEEVGKTINKNIRDLELESVTEIKIVAEIKIAADGSVDTLTATGFNDARIEQITRNAFGTLHCMGNGEELITHLTIVYSEN